MIILCSQVFFSTCCRFGCVWSPCEVILYKLYALSAQVQATDADQGENGKVLYRILTGECCITWVGDPASLLYKCKKRMGSQDAPG